MNKSSSFYARVDRNCPVYAHGTLLNQHHICGYTVYCTFFLLCISLFFWAGFALFGRLHCKESLVSQDLNFKFNSQFSENAKSQWQMLKTWSLDQIVFFIVSIDYIFNCLHWIGWLSKLKHNMCKRSSMTTQVIRNN